MHGGVGWLLCPTVSSLLLAALLLCRTCSDIAPYVTCVPPLLQVSSTQVSHSIHKQAELGRDPCCAATCAASALLLFL
jgi:hypothetical protein